MSDTPASPTPDDETRPFGAQPAGQQTLEPGTAPPAAEATTPPVAPPFPPQPGPYAGSQGGQPGYPGYPGYPGQPGYPGYPGYPPPERPRFRDQVLGMRSVIAVALVALVIGGLGGALLGALSNGGGNDARFGGRGGGFPPGGFQQGQQGQLGQQGRLPQQQFQQSRP